MKISNLKDRSYWNRFFSKNARLLWSLAVSLVIAEIFRLVYFSNFPLLEIQFFGEALIGGIIFLLIYFFGIYVVRFIGDWFEKVLGNLIRKVLYDFWRTQSSRLAETIKRESSSDGDVEPSFSSKTRAVILDTSAIIDGRIIGVINTGFLDSNIIVTQNVIDELKFMADKKDVLKREKGRRGLDILKEIKKIVGKEKFFLIDLKTKPEEVDDSLVQYCKKNNAKIATVDYNLNKAAQVAGVEVLNVNKLANEVRLQLLPGEVMLIKLVQEGKEEKQAVGYLEDGTMIVVKDSAHLVGEHKEVIVDKVLQTSAGRMIFASLHVEV